MSHNACLTCLVCTEGADQSGSRRPSGPKGALSLASSVLFRLSPAQFFSVTFRGIFSFSTHFQHLVLQDCRKRRRILLLLPPYILLDYLIKSVVLNMLYMWYMCIYCTYIHIYLYFRYTYTHTYLYMLYIDYIYISHININTDMYKINEDEYGHIYIYTHTHIPHL